MTSIYSELPLIPTNDHPHLIFWKEKPKTLTLESPAKLALIGFGNPFSMMSIEGTMQIDEALLYMKHNHIGVLFVTEEDDSVIGIITINDIIGEKPMLYLQAHEGPSTAYRRADIVVKDLMEPIEQLALIKYSVLNFAKIGDVLETFKKTGEYYLLAVETEEDSSDITIRGLLSAIHIEKTLGIHLDITKIPTSFSEVEHCLAHE